MDNLKLLLEKANNGDAEALYKLGRAFESGDGVEKNLAAAKIWYQKSADHGYENANLKLQLWDVQAESMGEQAESPRKRYQAPPVPHNYILESVQNQSDNTLPQADTQTQTQVKTQTQAQEQAKTASKTETVTGQKSKTVAALLAAFGGCFGAHDFYLGHTTQGIIKIFATLTCIGICVTNIWAWVDFIRILCNSKLDSNGQLLK